MRVIAASLLVAAPALVSAAVTPVRRSITGFATWYTTQTGNPGSCGSYLDDNVFTVAMNSNQYNDGLCGKTVTITAKGKTTQAKVMDLCPEGGGNCHYGDMDLSPSLFSYFADLGDGKIPMEWDFTDAAPATPPTQDTPPHVEPPAAPTTPTVESSVVYEHVAEVPTSSEVAPVVEPTHVEEQYVEPTPEPTPEPWTESTETTTETPTTTETSAAAASTTPSVGDKLALAITDGNVSGLAEALLDLGYMLKNSTDSTGTSY